MPEFPFLLVTDFDGTITDFDFYELAVGQCVPAGTPDYWALYSRGEISHFEAMRRIYRHIRCDEAALRRIVSLMRPDPGFGAGVAALREHGWDIVVVSNGCLWYIEQLLEQAGVNVKVHSSPGRFVEGQGLLMEEPEGSPYFNPAYGIDKAAVVREALGTYQRVAFAGNGPPDLKAALLTDPDLRFARGWLADKLTELGQPFTPFARWSSIPKLMRGRSTHSLISD